MKCLNSPSPTLAKPPQNPLASWNHYCRQKIVPQEALLQKVATLKQEGKTIATLNGAFDLLHPGHLFMIYEAAQLADVLILALNADASIAKSKGKNRPLLPLEVRQQMLAPLEFVTFITSFDEPTPCNLLSAIAPDVHVNGAEYGANCVEKEVVEANGGKVVLLPRIANLSTTNLIKKIQQTCDA